MKKDIEERKEQSVVLIEFSFDEVLMTFIDSYELSCTSRDVDLLIEKICKKYDFQGFSVVYCDGVCEGEDYLSYVFNHGNIEYLIRDWSFNKDKFYLDFIIPFQREENLRRILD